MRAFETRSLSRYKLRAMADRSASSKGTSRGGSTPSWRQAYSIASAGGAGLSLQQLWAVPGFGRAIEAGRMATMSSRWMRLYTWPGLSMRRARPARAVSSALRHGP